MLNENEIITQFQARKLNGIVDDENCCYVALRVTGMGETLRYDDGYYVENRRKSDFITKDVLDKCARLPITFGHPKDNQLLNNNTIKNTRIIGQTIAAWVDGDEIWAVGRIYDKDAIGNEYKSTSPGVLSKVEYEINGVLQEVPLEINHLAIVKNGHWDTIAKEQAIRLDNLKKEVLMAEETKIVNDAIVEQVASEKEKEVKKDANEVNVDAADKEVAETKEVEAEKEKEADTEEVKDDKCGEKEVEVKDDANSTPESRAAGTTGDWKVNTIKGIENIRKQNNNDEAVHNDEEFVSDKFLTESDAKRDEVIKVLRATCDMANPRLSVKMPYIAGRETPRSILKKFVELNPTIVSKKYASLMQNRVDAIPSDFIDDILSELKDVVAKREQELPKGKANEWIDSGKGYATRLDW